MTPLATFNGETESRYTGFQNDGKYSWVKAPTFYGKRAEVGPLADILVGVASGNERYGRHPGQAIITPKTFSQQPDIPPSTLESTSGQRRAGNR